MSKKTSKKKVSEIKGIPTIIKSEDKSVSPETFDFLEEMKKRINPHPYSWDEIYVWVTKYPTLDPYLEVDRTTMPETRPCMGSVTVHSQRPDKKRSHFGFADFWDTNELHHNPEFWWYDFDGKPDYDKNVEGHRKFDIEQNYRLELTFDDEPVSIDFRGRRPDEKTKPKKYRRVE